ncbi:2-keto-4-pentenoate hydratase [Rhodococcus jostii]
MRHRSGHPLSLSNLRVPRVEPEIALILRRELGNDAETVASLYDAISFVAPSMEILDSRYHTNAPSLPDVISDGASAAGFVVGEPVPYDPSEDPDLEQIRCAFLINGSPVAGASATEALGGPVRALAALVEIVRGQGRRVPAGAIVMTGGLTRAFPINPGDLVAADFGPILGRVELPTTP